MSSLVVAASVGPACTGPADAYDSFFSGTDEASGSAGGTSGSSTTAATVTTSPSTSTDPDDSTGAFKFDVPSSTGGPMTTDSAGSEGCRGVDFLFVIDNSGSMGDEQQSLIESFPSFVGSIQSKLAALEATEFHVMVVDTDAAPIKPGVSDPLCHDVCMSYPDADCSIPCEDALDCTGCDCLVGAGRRTTPAGSDCGLVGSERYITEDQPDLATTFQCLAGVGTNGAAGERQVDALKDAISPELVDPGGCNEGFLRNDSILVATIISDEDDEKDLDGGGSKGYPQLWKEAIVEAKGGDEGAIVMLGLIGDASQPNAICEDFGMSPDGAEDAVRLRQLVTSFPRHVLGSVCADDYGPFFQEAVDLIEETCGDFVPEG